jgi:hypothetical protein
MSVMAIGKKREGERNEKKMESEKEWTTSYTFDCPRAIRSAVFCINGGRRSNRTRPPPPYSHLPPSSLPATSTHYTRYARPPLFSVQNRAPDPNPNLSYLGSDLVTSVCMYYAYRILCFGKNYRLYMGTPMSFIESALGSGLRVFILSWVTSVVILSSLWTSAAKGSGVVVIIQLSHWFWISRCASRVWCWVVISLLQLLFLNSVDTRCS